MEILRAIISTNDHNKGRRMNSGKPDFVANHWYRQVKVVSQTRKKAFKNAVIPLRPPGIQSRTVAVFFFLPVCKKNVVKQMMY